VRCPKAVLFDFDDTLFDNSFIPAAVEQTCRAVAEAVAGLDPAALMQANTAAWSRLWATAERRCWLDELDVLDVTEQTWREALQACGVDDASVAARALETHQRIFRTRARLFDDVPGLLDELAKAGTLTALVRTIRPGRSCRRLSSSASRPHSMQS
jgi:FMN phosphatase YigB (HAD superfamily)